MPKVGGKKFSYSKAGKKAAKKYAKRTVVSTNCISKYELLTIIKEVYNKDIIINEDDSVKANKCLNGQIKTTPIKEQLKELKAFYDN